MRARFVGYTVARRHAPQIPTTTSPTTMNVSPAPIRKSHSTLATLTTAQPVGLATVWPRPPGFHAVREVAEEVAGAGGQREELPDRRHPVVDQRAAGEDDADQQEDPGRRDGERALPPSPDVGLGADVGLGVPRPAERRQAGAAPVLQAEDLVVADLAGLGDRPASGQQRRGARDQPEQRPHRSPRLPEPAGEQRRSTISTDRQQHHLERAQRQPAAAGERDDGAHAVAGPQEVVVEVGPAGLELLAVAGAGLRARPRRGRR